MDVKKMILRRILGVKNPPISAGPLRSGDPEAVTYEQLQHQMNINRMPEDLQTLIAKQLPSDIRQPMFLDDDTTVQTILAMFEDNEHPRNDEEYEGFK